MTDKKRPWRLVQTWEPDERRVWAYFSTREHALRVRGRETKYVVWSSVKWHLEHWAGSRWEEVKIRG